MSTRDFLLYRIICGYIKFGRLQIFCPTPQILYEANQVYLDTLNKAKELDIMNDSDLLQILIQEQLWTYDDEKNLNKVVIGHIDYWKKEIYKYWWKENDRNKYRKFLLAAKKEHERLFNIRTAYNYATCDGIAAYAKYQYIIENSTFLNGIKYDWDEQSPYAAMIYFQNNIIKEEELRDLSHNQPWEGMWIAGKREKSIFGKPSVELTSEQCRLIGWSSMYENIREHPEVPPEEIINDNDALDGWLILQKEERDKKHFEKRIEGQIQNKKIQNADEIYIMANVEDDLTKISQNTIDNANKIDEMNSIYSKMLKKQRFKIIDKLGQINEQALPDVKQDFMMQLAQAQANKMKG